MEEKDQKLIAQIQAIRADHPFYGMKRVKLEMAKQGQKVALNRISRVCNLYHLKPKSYCPHPKARDRNLPQTGIPNLLKELQEKVAENGSKNQEKSTKQNSKNAITKPNQAWCSDFTYLQIPGILGWYYLATLIDVFTKEIVGFSLSKNHNTEMITSAFAVAVGKFGNVEIAHSDQGSEYRSAEYLNVLHSYQTKASNSAKASPWENGFQESFYGKFKPELELQNLPFCPSFREIYDHLAKQMDYYNNHRIHTSIWEIPSLFRKKYEAKTRNRRQHLARNLR